MKSFGLYMFSCLISIGLAVFVVVEVGAFPHAQRGEWYQTYSQDHQPHFSPVNPGFPLLNTKSKTREWHTNYASSGNSVLTKRQSAVSLNPLEMVSSKLRELGQQVVKGFSKLTRFDTRDQDSFSRDFLQPSIDSDSDDYLFVPGASDQSPGSQTHSFSGSSSSGSYFNDGEARSSAHNEIPPSSYHYYTPSNDGSSDSGSFSLPSDERVQLTSASTSDHYSRSSSEAFFVDHPTRHVISHQPSSSGGMLSFFEYVANDLKKAGDWMMGMLGMETHPDEAYDVHKDRLIIDQNMANGQHPYLTDFPESPFADLLYEEYLASSGASTQAPFYPNAEFSYSQGQGEYVAQPATTTSAPTKPPVPIKLLISAQVAQEHADEVKTLPIEVVAGSDTTRLVLELPASQTKGLDSPTLIKTTGGRERGSIGIEASTTNGNEYKATIEAKTANGLQSKADNDYDDIILVSTEEHDNNIGDENAIIQREDKTFMRVYDKTLGRSILREMTNIYRPVARPSLTKDFSYQASDHPTQQESGTKTSGPNPNPPTFESEIAENQNNVALTSQDADSVDLGQIATSQVIIESDKSDKSDDTALYIIQEPGAIDYEFLSHDLRNSEDYYNQSKERDFESSAEPQDLEPEATTLSAVVNAEVPTSDGALIIYPTSDDDKYHSLTQGATTTSESTSTVITSSVSSTAQIGLSKGATKLSDWTRKLEAALSSSSSQDDPTSIPQIETKDLGPKVDFTLSAGQSSSINQTTTTDEGLVPVSSSSVLAPKPPTETLSAADALVAGEDHLLDHSEEKKRAKEGAVKEENTLNGLFIEDDWDNSNFWQGETSREADQLRELLVTRKKLLHKLKEKRKDKKQILLAKLKKD